MNLRTISPIALRFLAATVLTSPAEAADTPPAPLELAATIDAAMSGNRELLAARERIEAVKADHIVVRSRLMPQLSLTASFDGRSTETRSELESEVASRLLFEQRLFEFGPNAAQEVRFRSDLREVVFGYEEQVYTVLSRVWEIYHLIVLKNRQIALREASRDSFKVFLDKQTARFDERLASEEDKLLAELNVIDEELEINRLRQRQFIDKMELLRLIARPIGAQVEMTGELAPFPFTQDEAVRIALARDVEIGLNTELLDEQRRVVREQRWEYAPDVSLQAGVDDGRRNAALTIDRREGTWGVNMAAGLDLEEAAASPPAPEGATWQTQLTARFPLFEGASRIGQEAQERARLRQLEIELRDLRAGVDLRVRQAYQSMLEVEVEERLQQQSVHIARRRLEIYQFLQEKGQADEAKLEQLRNQFFGAQQRLFIIQETYISRQARLRRLMGYVE